jgi:predicted Zn finger-like uncharacterized protein
MIVSCPQCSARYRIRDEKIQGAGARIGCPSCHHKFVVYREAEKFVVGGTAAQPKGVPVTFARGGELKRAEVPEEEDEDAEAPTTLMPHGSSGAEQLRQALQAQRDQSAAEAVGKPRAPAPAPTPARPPDPKPVAREAAPRAAAREEGVGAVSPAGEGGGDELRAARPQPPPAPPAPAGSRFVLGLAVGGFVVVLAAGGAAYALGWLG